ncbi:unnamed protein product [Symbiodinium sp. CCMP2592]|nr:unnamed protein product [Symbiodinium sp. CCMP2592]
MYGGSAQITVELKPLVTSYGICGGSGGGGAYARAMVEVKAGRTYRVEAGRGGKGAIGGHGAESGQSSRFLEKDDAGEWHVLAEARGGFGAGSFDQKLNFSPGGQGGAVPNFPAHAEDWDYFVSCDVQCLGTKWPSSPVGGKGPTAGHDAAGRVGLMGRVHAGHGGNGSCPQVLRDCQPTLQRTPGAAGQNGLAILRRCRMEGAYTLALQRCDGSSNWSIHGLWPRGVRDCQEINLDLSTLSGLKAELLKKWPSCQQSTTTEAFWQHEWQKHGTCLSSSPAHYFELALRLLGQHAHACAEYTSTDCRLCLTEDFELCTRDSSKSAPEGAAP